MLRCVVGNGRQCLFFHDFVGQEFRQASAGCLFCATYCWLRSLSDISLVTIVVWRVQDTFMHALHFGWDVGNMGPAESLFLFIFSASPRGLSINSRQTSSLVAQDTKRWKWKLPAVFSTRPIANTVSLPPFLLCVKTGRSLPRFKGYGNRSHLSKGEV